MPRLANQVSGLERRTARGGRDSIDHAPGGHDDLANAALGAMNLARPKPYAGWALMEHYRQAVEQQRNDPQSPDFGYTIIGQSRQERTVRLRAPAGVTQLIGMSGACYPIEGGLATVTASDAAVLDVAIWQRVDAQQPAGTPT